MKTKINKSWFTSELQEWQTPKGLFAQLDEIYNFTLDAAASPENALCKKYFTAEDDALKQKWIGRVFCNPPFRMAAKFFQKAADEIKESYCEIIVMLTPARTDTKYFHEIVYLHAAEIWFLKGRVKYVNPYKTNASNPPFPSMIVIFNKYADPDFAFHQLKVRSITYSDKQ